MSPHTLLDFNSESVPGMVCLSAVKTVLIETKLSPIRTVSMSVGYCPQLEPLVCLCTVKDLR